MSAWMWWPFMLEVGVCKKGGLFKVWGWASRLEQPQCSSLQHCLHRNERVIDLLALSNLALMFVTIFVYSDEWKPGSITSSAMITPHPVHFSWRSSWWGLTLMSEPPFSTFARLCPNWIPRWVRWTPTKPSSMSTSKHKSLPLMLEVKPLMTLLSTSSKVTRWLRMLTCSASSTSARRMLMMKEWRSSLCHHGNGWKQVQDSYSHWRMEHTRQGIGADPCPYGTGQTSPWCCHYSFC